MMSCHELFGFMSPKLANEILETTAASDKELYRAISAAVAESRKLRPAFFDRKPRTERNAQILESLTKPRLESTSENLLRNWLLKSETPLLKTFLDAAGIAHKEGAIGEMPKQVDAERLKAGVDKLLENHSQEKVVVYLNVFYAGNKESTSALASMLREDPRLQLS
jgi:hypothetical protein